MKTLKSIVLGLTVTVGLTVSSFAAFTPLAPGGAVVPGVDVVPGGAPLATLTSPLVGSISGVTLTSDVYAGSGGLLFVYTVYNGSSDNLGRLTLNGWLGVTTGVANATTSGDPAFTADRGASGNPIGFNWAPSGFIDPGNTAIVMVQTDWRTYARSTGFVINGGVAGGSILAPVPEPTTLAAGALLLLPFAASTIRSWRRNRG